MVKMVLGSSDSQATSVAALADSYTAAFESLISAFDTLANEDKLSGSAYTNIKSYGSSVVAPLVKAFILLADAAKADVQKLPDEYRAQVGGEDLDEETLTAQISAYATTIEANQTSATSLGKTEPMTDAVQASINSLNDAVASDTATKAELEEKLRKLLEYNAQSSGFFSDIASLESAVTTGLSQLQAGVTSFNGTFTLPSQKDLAWTKTVNSQWEEREAYLEAVEKGKKGEELNDEDVKALTAYAQSHPGEEIDSRVVDAIKKYVDKIKEDYDKNSTNYDIYANVVEQLGLGVQRLGGLLSVLGGIKGPATVDAKGVSTAFVLVNQNGVGQALVRNGSKVASIGKGLGYGLMGLGFGLGMYDDLANKGKTVGQAVVHNGLSTGLSWGAGSVTASGLTAVAVATLGTTPVGWAAVGIAAVGWGAGYLVGRGFDLAYNNNFGGLQDGLDAAGDWLDDAGKSVGQAVSKGVENAKNWAKDTADGVGDAIYGGLSALNPFD